MKGLVTQRPRVLPRHGRSRRFESCLAHHFGDMKMQVKVGQKIWIKGYPMAEQTNKKPYEVVFVSPLKEFAVIYSEKAKRENTIKLDGFWNEWEIYDESKHPVCKGIASELGIGDWWQNHGHDGKKNPIWFDSRT